MGAMGRLACTFLAFLMANTGCSLLNEPRTAGADGGADAPTIDGAPSDGGTDAPIDGPPSTLVLVDHFDNLANWTNTSNSTTGWVIDASGHAGSGAKTQIGGAGFGDQLERTINFASASTLRLWANKMNSDFITVTIKIDGVAKATYQGDASGFGVWKQLSISVPAGSHVVRIESDLAGTAWVDEMEVFTP